MRFLLLQVRNDDDPMRANEVAAFSRAIGCPPSDIGVLDVFEQTITQDRLKDCDVVLVGGAGNYSTAMDIDDPWLLRMLDGLRLIYDTRTPMFASCFGFQALARALGGTVVHDPGRAELGTHRLFVTAEGRADRLFGSLPDHFLAQMGHEDHVAELPPGAIRLASSDAIQNQAYTFADRPIYATQFHPELEPSDMIARVAQYPGYLRHVTGLTPEEFAQRTQPTPDLADMVRRFVAMVRK